jgi:retinol dehydrogenase-14
MIKVVLDGERQMSTKTILVTGATDGIGKQTALELARQGHHVLVHGRNAARGARIVAEIKNATHNAHVDWLHADFAVMAEVRRLAAEINARYERLDVLINNAGVLMPQRTLTPDGLETTFAINHLAHFLLTNLLLEKIKHSAPARIITVSSGMHRGARIEWDNLQGEKNYTGYDAYARSKLANVLFAFELAARLAGAQVTSNALHPGVIHTKLLHAGSQPGAEDLARGARTSVYLATAPEVAGVTGKYFENSREAVPAPLAQDKRLRQEFWRVSARLVGLAES